MKNKLASGLPLIKTAGILGALAMVLCWASVPKTVKEQIDENVIAASSYTKSNGHIMAQTVEGFARQNGRWPLTKSEAEEIVKAMELLRGHEERAFGSVNAVLISPAQQLRNEADRIEQREKARAWAVAVMEKWRARANDLTN